MHVLLCYTIHLHNYSLLSSPYNILEWLKHCRCWYEMVHAIPVPIVDWLHCPLSQLGFCRRSNTIPTGTDLAWLSSGALIGWNLKNRIIVKECASFLADTVPITHQSIKHKVVAYIWRRYRAIGNISNYKFQDFSHCIQPLVHCGNQHCPLLPPNPSMYINVSRCRHQYILLYRLITRVFSLFPPSISPVIGRL